MQTAESQTGPPPRPNGTPRHDPALVRHLTLVRRWCRKRSGDDDFADEIVQETAVAALKRIETLRNPESLKSWLFRIAQRQIIEAGRRRRPPLPLTVEPQAPQSTMPQHAHEHAFEHEDEHGHVHGHGRDGAWKRPPDYDYRLMRQVKKAIRRLPHDLRVPMRLHYLKGKPIREVAKKLDLTKASVKSRLYRARRRIRKELMP